MKLFDWLHCSPWSVSSIQQHKFPYAGARYTLSSWPDTLRYQLLNMVLVEMAICFVNVSHLFQYRGWTSKISPPSICYSFTAHLPVIIAFYSSIPPKLQLIEIFLTNCTQKILQLKQKTIWMKAINDLLD